MEKIHGFYRVWTHDQAWSDKLKAKCYNHSATVTLQKWKRKSEKRSIRHSILLYKVNFWPFFGTNVHFWLISAYFRLMRPIFLKIRQNLPFFTFNTFVGASRCSVSNFDYLVLIRESFDKIFSILQNSTIFCPNFHNFDTLIHICYIKIKENFSLCTKFEFSKNSLVRFQLF